MRGGAVVFAAGAVAVLAIVVPYLLGHGRDAPSVLNLLALLLPVGLGAALLGLFLGTRE